MLSVHGIEVAGATFPAQIWHDYMNVAHGSFCGDFAPPKTPFQPQPFFGKYSRTGGSGDRNYNSYGTGTNSYGQQNGQTQNGQSQSPTSKYNDPNLYESPPQTAPVPTPTPTPGTGNGNGNGNGQAKPPKPGGGNGNGQ